jgi:hypothetical protein
LRNCKKPWGLMLDVEEEEEEEEEEVLTSMHEAP